MDGVRVTLLLVRLLILLVGTACLGYALYQRGGLFPVGACALALVAFLAILRLVGLVVGKIITAGGENSQANA